MAATLTIEQQYAALNAGPAWIDRSGRALIEVTGKDRAAWAHNLTTNQVKTLSPGEGNYAFVLNVQGRILFDLNILVRPDSIWIDIDRRFLPVAMKHFQKYIIMEDVSVKDRSGELFRFALAGQKAKDLCARFGASNAAAMPLVSSSVLHIGEPNRAANGDDANRAASVSLGPAVSKTRRGEAGERTELSTPIVSTESAVDFFRSDFCGVFAVDLIAPAGKAAQLQPDSLGAIPVGDEAVNIRRIEVGIPWPLTEINDEALSAETRQLERAVSFQKGCYLGQEIVERMRARKVVARLLSGLKIEGEEIPPTGAELRSQDSVVGKITSACRSIALGQTIALGYIKPAAAAPGTAISVNWDGQTAPAIVAPLPFA